MTRIFSSSLFLLLLCSITVCFAGQNQSVTITLPESVLAQTIKQSLPVKIDPRSESVGGTIQVSDVKNLYISENTISALLFFEGRDLQIKTKLAGRPLRLNIGDAQMNMKLSTSVRFDPNSRTLLIKPTVNNLETGGSGELNQLGVIMTGLFNGKEYPVQLNDFAPIITDTGTGKIALDMELSGVSMVERALMLHLKPTVRRLPETAQ